MTVKQKRTVGIMILILLSLTMLMAFWFIGRPLLQFVEDPEQYRAWIQDKGFFAQLSLIGMMFFQSVIAIIPAEPLEICAGYAFGSWEGTFLCLAGLTLGSAVIFVLVRRFGIKLVEIFFPIEKIRSLSFLQESKKRNLLAFIVMFIPGTPKDLISYFAGLTDIRMGEWLVIATIARIPSILTSTVGGNALAEQKYIFAVIVFIVTAAISGIGIVVYNRLSKGKK